jgi:hypothetical protein
MNQKFAKMDFKSLRTYVIEHHDDQERTSEFQKALESVENLPLDDQEILLDIIKKREQLTQDIKEIRQEITNGNAHFGSVARFLEALDQG